MLPSEQEPAENGEHKAFHHGISRDFGLFQFNVVGRQPTWIPEEGNSTYRYRVPRNETHTVILLHLEAFVLDDMPCFKDARISSASIKSQPAGFFERAITKE